MNIEEFVDENVKICLYDKKYAEAENEQLPFMQAMLSGNILTLEQFKNAFNDGELNLENKCIKIMYEM